MLGFPHRFGAAFWLQAALLVTAAASLQAAGWVEAPLLAPAAFLAAATATHAFGSAARRTFIHLRAAAGGILFACASGILVTDGDQPHEKLSALLSGLQRWLSAVANGETVSDPLPLSVTITALTLATAYLTTWGFLRYRSIWITFLPVGAVTIINVTYLPGSTSPYLWAFLFLSLLMLAHSTSRGRLEALLEQGVAHPGSLHRLSLALGLGLSATIVAMTAMLPVSRSPITPLGWFYNPVNGAATGEIRDEVRRVFGAPSSSEPLSIRFLGSVLSLVRPVSNSAEPIMFVEAEYPFYWSAVAYDHYTSKVWKVQDTATQSVAPSPEAPPAADTGVLPLKQPIDYAVYLYVDPPYLFMAGDPVDVEPSAQLQAPSLPAYRLDLAEPGRSDDLPEDLRALESELAGTAGSPDVSRLPEDLRVSAVVKSAGPAGEQLITAVDPGSPTYADDLRGALDGPGVTLALDVSRAPLEDSPVLYTTQGQLGLGNSYLVTSEVLVADEATLRAASPEYPPGIAERYLQIPPSLPERVSALAADLVAGAANPYDMAVAIETHLRTLDYSGVPIFLPNEADAVDYFLFETGKSYSDYFASAMAMMLRTQGVPTRLVLGFGPGEADPEGYLIRDSDNHSWPEVYFPGVGWAPFEPTPIYPVRPRGTDLFLPGEDAEAVEVESPAVDTASREAGVDFGTPLGAGGLMFLGFILAGAVVMRVLWATQYGAPWSAQAAYRRMQRLAALLGFRSPSSHTAYEFSQSLSTLIPEARPEVELVARAYVRQRYGRAGSQPAEEAGLAHAWSRIKWAALFRLR